jgi:hypothetical protein
VPFLNRARWRFLEKNASSECRFRGAATLKPLESMKSSHLIRLRLLALFFLLPGLGGLIVSAVVSTIYLDSLPRSPVPDELRTVPRNIHGTVVYQTAKEDGRLSIMEYSSVGVFVIGLSLGIFYLERWGNVRSSELELEEDDLSTASSK